MKKLNSFFLSFLLFFSGFGSLAPVVAVADDDDHDDYVSERNTALVAAKNERNAALSQAVEARKAAMDAAKSLSDKDARKDAIKEALDEYKDDTKSIKDAYKDMAEKIRNDFKNAIHNSDDDDEDEDEDEDDNNNGNNGGSTGTNNSPVISSITAPTVLSVGQVGTWTVKAFDPKNGSLTYSVDWGDVPLTSLRLFAAPIFVQTSTFTHAYSNPGTYTITFKVENAAGKSTTSTVNVRVTGSVPTPLPGVLAAEDFGVVNYNTGLGILKGYTAGFGLTDATFAGATSVVVRLYAAGNQLLQTNTAILPKFNADITGTQFSSPFDVSGSFNYASDGYWTNVREAQYGQSIPAVKVVASVTLANGKVVTAENTNLVGDPTTIYPVSADVTPPNILFATNVGVNASSTSLIWVTDEASDSKIWVSTTTPVATTTAPTASSSGLSYFHQLFVPGLATSTLYYYVVSSTDVAGNASYHSGSFTAPNI